MLDDRPPKKRQELNSQPTGVNLAWVLEVQANPYDFREGSQTRQIRNIKQKLDILALLIAPIQETYLSQGRCHEGLGLEPCAVFYDMRAELLRKGLSHQHRRIMVSLLGSALWTTQYKSSFGGFLCPSVPVSQARTNTFIVISRRSTRSFAQVCNWSWARASSQENYGCRSKVTRPLIPNA